MLGFIKNIPLTIKIKYFLWREMIGFNIEDVSYEDHMVTVRNNI